MSYNIAYTSQFGDPSGLLWRVEIWRDNAGDPLEIGLDADQPVIIEWQGTKLQDAVCPSQCTLKVVNDTDRQMVPLATDEYAFCKVFRDGKLYWTGVLDQGVYEEPYSYNDAYVTEITFSDFGALNRFDFHPFSQAGRSDHIVSLRDIVSAALTLICLDNVPLAQNISMILPGWGGNHAHLHHLYVNSERFEGMTYREVLERILQPLSYRIVQKAGAVWVYDAEWMFDNATVTTVTWKGDDARLSFGEVYGKFDLKFDRDSRPVIADGSLDPDDDGFKENGRYYAIYKDEIVTWGAAFFIDGIKPTFNGKIPLGLNRCCKPVRLRGKYSSVHEACLARMIQCYDHNSHDLRNLLENDIIYDGANTDNVNFGDLFSLESWFLPKTNDKEAYQLRVNLDMLFSPKSNPFDTKTHEPLEDKKWKIWEKLRRVSIPAKLELLAADGTILKHYENVMSSPQAGQPTVSYGLGEGVWVDGAGEWRNMCLCFYTADRTNPCAEWVSNRQFFSSSAPSSAPEGVFRQDSGEYIPLPSASGRLRLTVSDKLTIRIEGDNVSFFGNYEENSWYADLFGQFRWQLYRNPTITVVRNHYADNKVDKEAIAEEATVSAVYKDTYAEDSAVGTVQDGVSPACLGLLLQASGEAYDGLIKKGVKQSLLRHRLNILQDQLSTPHSILSGTAELTPGMCIRSDASTAGKFLVTALRQDPRSGTEEVSMTRISPGGERYAFSWSDPVCVTEEEGYRHQWGSPVCIKVPERYAFSWSGPVCARVSVIVGPCWNDI